MVGEIPSTCELCEAARVTPWHHEDDVCWVADCEACGVPMVVWRHHGTDPAPGDVDHMLAALARVADAMFGPDRWQLDRSMRAIPDHAHAHARDEAWFVRKLVSRRSA